MDNTSTSTKFYILYLMGDLCHGNQVILEKKCVSTSRETLDELQMKLQSELMDEFTSDFEEDEEEIYTYDDMDFTHLEWCIDEIEVV